MNNIEILAPAGAREQLEAAVRAGCDAVYLGYGNFNARRNAKNFTFLELKEAVEYCHVHNVKVHATINTLVMDNEMVSAYNTIKEVTDAGVDAVIVQDLGVAKIIKECFPSLEMHASTQLTAHNLSGVKELEFLGFSRVVLSRELSFDEIKYICENAKAEIEVFVHGALCMCFSGGCYLSSILGQRSGNRGLCAQPCRLDFKVNNREYALSLKDMCHIPYINKLKEIGVASLKIEGRMKRPEYVYSAVTACRDALSGKKPDIENLKRVFSRSGFTDGYLINKRNLEMFGYRRKEDVVASEGVLKDIAQKYKNEVQDVPIFIEASLYKDEKARVKISDGVNTVEVWGDIPQNAINRPTESEDIKKQLSKTGGTPYYIKKIEVSVDAGLSYPISSLNALRRQALEMLTKKRTEFSGREIKELKTEKENNPRKNTIVLRVSDIKQLDGIKDDVAVIIPIDRINENILSRFSLVIGELPSIIFDEGKIKMPPVKHLYCDNVGAVNIAKKYNLTVIGGWGLNILNSQSVFKLKEMGASACTLSFEASKRSVEETSNPIPVGILGYGYLPLMRMRACPVNNCKGCNGINVLADRKNVKFMLTCHNKQYVTLLNSLPLYAGDKNIQADFHILYFTLENSEEVNKIYNMYKKGETPDFTRTNGLYFKNLI